MEELLSGLLEALFGTLLEIVGEALLELAFELFAEAPSGLINRWRETSPTTSVIGLAFAGAVAGLLSAWLFPHRLIAARVVLPGVSLLLTPLATGSAMYFLGKRLRRVGRCPSNLATFHGGAIFALSMSLIRWWLVGLPH